MSYYQRSFYERHRDHIWIAGAVALLAVIGFGGCNSRPEIVRKCVSTSSAWVRANFSESKWVTGFDFDGNITTEWETDTWSKSASPVFKLKTVNGELRSRSHVFDPVKADGYLYPPIPGHDRSMSRWSHFDDFSRHRNNNLRVHTRWEGGVDHFDTKIAGTRKCLTLIGEPILVKTWYGISYDTDWWAGTNVAS